MCACVWLLPVYQCKEGCCGVLREMRGRLSVFCRGSRSTLFLETCNQYAPVYVTAVFLGLGKEGQGRGELMLMQFLGLSVG